jgi:putative ABC transport system substrate-binding protein
MRRRDFISVLGAAAVLSSTRSRAQQPSKTYLISVLASAQIPYLINVLKDGLRKLSYVEGQDLKFEYRFAVAGWASADMLAAELVKLGPDVIIALGTAEAIAAKRATTTVPIVIIIADPLGTGIVTNVAHPGGNVTGIIALWCRVPSLAARYRVPAIYPFRQYAAELRDQGLWPSLS